jgi:hypothetical protein
LLFGNVYLFFFLDLVSIFGTTTTANQEYTVDMYPFPHPELVTIDIVGNTGPFFFFGALMFNFVIQIGSIVSEKQNKLRESLRIMGLKVSVFNVRERERERERENAHSFSFPSITETFFDIFVENSVFF